MLGEGHLGCDIDDASEARPRRRSGEHHGRGDHGERHERGDRRVEERTRNPAPGDPQGGALQQDPGDGHHDRQCACIGA